MYRGSRAGCVLVAALERRRSLGGVGAMFRGRVLVIGV